MNAIPLSKTKIETKLAIIRESLSELQSLVSKTNKESFVSSKDQTAIAEHYIRRALEAVFDIANHVLSRFPFSPGKRPFTYKEMAIALGDKGVVDKEFADRTLMKMAGYRNRLIHFYDEVTSEELFNVICDQLSDFDTFAKAIVKLINDPQKLGLIIED